MAINKENDQAPKMEQVFRDANINRPEPEPTPMPNEQYAYTEQPAYIPEPPPVPRKPFSFHSGSMFAAPINRSIGSEVYNKIKDNLAEMYQQVIDPNMEIALLDLDSANDPALAFSSIIVAMRNKAHGPSSPVTFNILLIEATGDDVKPVVDYINNRQVEILRVTGDALDDRLVLKAEEKVAKAFPGAARYLVDGCVIPRHFNPDDKYAIHKLALNAGLASGTELEVLDPEFKDINLAYIERDGNLTVNMNFNKQQIDDVVGNKMRSDVLINFESRKRQQNERVSSLNSGDTEVKVSEVSGFIDLVVAEDTSANPYNQFMQQPGVPMNTQKFVPRLIITNLASNFSYTVGSMLMNIYTGLSLTYDNNWIQTFKPNLALGKEIDLCDIGALNIPGNIKNEQGGWGTRIKTKTDNFKLEDLGYLVKALIKPGLIISLDCPEAGPQSWYTSVFAAASDGSEVAYNIIYNSMMELTNGNFGKYFQIGSPMFVDNNNRIHNGHWTDKNGNVRDIRDVDYLAVCNLVGDKNPNYIREWAGTFVNEGFGANDIPAPVKLDARKKMISSLTNETAEFTGFSQRVTFSANFIDAMVAAIKETGTYIKINTPMAGNDFNMRQSSAAFINSALVQQGQPFMAPPVYGNQYGYQQPGIYNKRY